MEGGQRTLYIGPTRVEFLSNDYTTAYLTSPKWIVPLKTIRGSKNPPAKKWFNKSLWDPLKFLMYFIESFALCLLHRMIRYVSTDFLRRLVLFWRRFWYPAQVPRGIVERLVQNSSFRRFPHINSDYFCGMCNNLVDHPSLILL